MLIIMFTIRMVFIPTIINHINNYNHLYFYYKHPGMTSCWSAGSRSRRIAPPSPTWSFYLGISLNLPFTRWAIASMMVTMMIAVIMIIVINVTTTVIITFLPRCLELVWSIKTIMPEFFLQVYLDLDTKMSLDPVYLKMKSNNYLPMQPLWVLHNYRNCMIHYYVITNSNNYYL